MSKEQLKDFLEKVKSDTSLQEKLKAAKSPEDVVAIAKEHGHEFTVDKINQLSEKELEGVTGGGNQWPASVMCGTLTHQCNCRGL